MYSFFKALPLRNNLYNFTVSSTLWRVAGKTSNINGSNVTMQNIWSKREAETRFTVIYLTHLRPMFPFYNPWKHRKFFRFLVFPRGMKWKHWPHMGCMKCVQMQSFFWSLFSCIHCKCKKIWTRKNSVFGHFSRSDG